MSTLQDQANKINAKEGARVHVGYVDIALNIPSSVYQQLHEIGDNFPMLSYNQVAGLALAFASVHPAFSDYLKRSVDATRHITPILGGLS